MVATIEGFDWHELPPGAPDLEIIEPPWQVYKTTMFEALTFRRRHREQARPRRPKEDDDSEPERALKLETRGPRSSSPDLPGC